jgi:hypothetical protein
VCLCRQYSECTDILTSYYFARPHISICPKLLKEWVSFKFDTETVGYNLGTNYILVCDALILARSDKESSQTLVIVHSFVGLRKKIPKSVHGLRLFLNIFYMAHVKRSIFEYNF